MKWKPRNNISETNTGVHTSCARPFRRESEKEIKKTFFGGGSETRKMVEPQPTFFFSWCNGFSFFSEFLYPVPLGGSHSFVQVKMKRAGNNTHTPFFFKLTAQSVSTNYYMSSFTSKCVDIVGTKVNNDLFRWMGITSCPKDSDG
jgi:hypothetical protein